MPGNLSVASAAQSVWSLHLQGDGATFNLYSGRFAGKSLYAVSVYSDRTRDVDEPDFSVDVIEAFIRANLDLPGCLYHRAGPATCACTSA